jgi:hypothetical protein
MSAAGLLARLAADGHLSTAPAPAWSWRCTPRRWELPHQGFKGSKNLTALGELVDRL